MSAPWRFVARWPVRPEAHQLEVCIVARDDLPELLEEAGAALVGDLRWAWIPAERGAELRAVGDAVPAKPTAEQWPVVVRYLAGLGWSDRRIGTLLGVPRDSVIRVRKLHNIPPGVPSTRSAT